MLHEVSFQSFNERDQVQGWIYVPAAEPKGIVQIIHGFGEHSRRYFHMIVKFMEAGYIVAADDHVGHGKTSMMNDTWGDWGDNKDLRLIFAGWHYLALKGALKMAKVLSFDEDAAKYCTLMDKIKTGYNKCWNGTEYRHPQYKDLTDDRVQALAVLTGIADKEKYPYILDILKKQFHASPYMERYVMEALFMMDEGSFAIQRMKERYAQMVNNTSYTTLFEGWDIGPNGFGGGTVNHAWSGGPLIVIAQYICGIKPLEPGWRSFEIAPNCDILESADIKVPTIAGKIHSKFCRTDNGVIMDIIVPCGTQALVKVPGPKCKITLINGVEQLCDKGYYFRLGAGKYHIEKKY